jgi:hypothetical protein
VELLAANLAKKTPGRRKTAARAQALQLSSQAIGAVVLARAVAAADPELSDEILLATRQALLP